jgi:lysophospholipase L1-like esterase
MDLTLSATHENALDPGTGARLIQAATHLLSGAMLNRFLRMALAATVFLAASGAQAADAPRWTATWATATMADDPGSRLPANAVRDVTIRQFLRISLGGQRLRLRLTNSFGTAPLDIDSIRVALADNAAPGAIRPGSSRVVRFDAAETVTIPAGAEYASDPIDLPARGLSLLAITFHLREVPARQTVHYVSKTTSYVAPGNTVDAVTLPGATSVEHWYQLAAVDAQAAPPARAVAVLGDSITDGHGSTTNGNDRWTDVLAERLQADPRGRNTAVLNFGISGNRLLKDGSGPSGMARLNREVLSQPGIKTLIVLEGVNDLGGLSREGAVTPERREAVVRGLIDGYAQVIAYAHARGVRAIGATILPFGGTRAYRSDADADADRQRVNAWIREAGHFDAVIDFDAVMRDPANPAQLLPAYDTGDRLHPSPLGYRAMGRAINLDELAK